MSLLDLFSSQLLSKLNSDTELVNLFNSKLVLRHGKGAGDEKFAYLVWNVEDTGPLDNTPITEGHLILDVWTYGQSTRQAQNIIKRLKILLHRTFIEDAALGRVRLWWAGQVQIMTDDTKIVDQAVRHFRCILRLRYYDLEIHEAELTN